MPNVTIGPGGITEQPIEIRYDIKRGYSTTRRFRGSEDGIYAKEFELKALGWATSIKGGPVWELEATIGLDDSGGSGSSEPTTTWELSGSAFEKDLLNCDCSAVNSLDPDDLSLLRDVFDGKWDASKKTSPAFTAPSSGDPLGLFNIWTAGTKSKRDFQPVLRLNQIAAPTYAAPSSLADVGKVLSTSYLLNSVSVPLAIANNLPPSSTVTKSGLSSDTIELYYGWLKHAPTITQSAFNKIQISQEWHYGLWSTILYAVVA